MTSGRRGVPGRRTRARGWPHRRCFSAPACASLFFLLCRRGLATLPSGAAPGYAAPEVEAPYPYPLLISATRSASGSEASASSSGSCASDSVSSMRARRAAAASRSASRAEESFAMPRAVRRARARSRSTSGFTEPVPRASCSFRLCSARSRLTSPLRLPASFARSASNRLLATSSTSLQTAWLCGPNTFFPQIATFLFPAPLALCSGWTYSAPCHPIQMTVEGS